MPDIQHCSIYILLPAYEASDTYCSWTTVFSDPTRRSADSGSTSDGITCLASCAKNLLHRSVGSVNLKTQFHKYDVVLIHGVITVEPAKACTKDLLGSTVLQTVIPDENRHAYVEPIPPCTWSKGQLWRDIIVNYWSVLIPVVLPFRSRSTSAIENIPQRRKERMDHANAR